MSDFNSICMRNRLPNQLQRKLNLARWRLGRSNQSSVANPLARRVEDISVIQRWREICVIEDIEKLRAELNVKSVGDALDIVILENRKIKVHKPGSNQSVPAEVSTQGNRVGDCEALRFDVMNRI